MGIEEDVGEGVVIIHSIYPSNCERININNRKKQLLT